MCVCLPCPTATVCGRLPASQPASLCVCVCVNFFVAYFSGWRIFFMFAYFISILFLPNTQPALACSVCVCVCIYIHCKICHENQQKCTPSSAHTHTPATPTHTHTQRGKMHVNEPQFAVFSFRFAAIVKFSRRMPQLKKIVIKRDREREGNTLPCVCDHCNCISILLLVSLEEKLDKPRSARK